MAATATAQAAHKVSASSAKVSISQKLQIIFEPSACACVWSCLVTVASRNWRSSSNSSRRCRQNELASRSQSESLRVCVCVFVSVLSARVCVWDSAECLRKRAKQMRRNALAPVTHPHLSLSCRSPALLHALFVSHCRCQLQLRFRL